MAEHRIERVWFGDRMRHRAARAALMPLSVLYRGVIGARNGLFDMRLLTAEQPRIPALSIGNLTVGGTGKTPVATWMARELQQLGARPSIVLRGYGSDEPLVHERLLPGVPVVTGSERAPAIDRAAELGADCVVLDDAFQHRQVHRVADIVLMSADQWDGSVRLLPAGPFREPLVALRRASLALVTRKAASDDQVSDVSGAISTAAPGLPVAVGHLALGSLQDRDGRELPLADLDGRRVLAVAAVGDPGAFARQLESTGASVELRAFRDHHAFTESDVAALVARAATGVRIVCTLKDAVKLERVWPRASPSFWYVSQFVKIHSGHEEIGRLLARLLEARRPYSHPPAAPVRRDPTHAD